MTIEQCKSPDGKPEKTNDSNISRREFIASAVAAGVSIASAKANAQTNAGDKGNRVMKAKPDATGKIQNVNIGGYMTTAHSESPDSFNAGFSIYSAA